MAPLTLGYFALVLDAAGRGLRLSVALGLDPSHAEALLVDLFAAAAPVLLAIAVYLRLLAAHRYRRRAAFLTAHDGQRLVYLATAPLQLYCADADSLSIVWNADGPVAQATRYPLPDDAVLRDVDLDRFLTQGRP